MMANYEKRFPEDFELQAQFLELVNYVYRFESVLFWLFLISLRSFLKQIESLSNDDGDGKENAHLAFFVHFFAVTARLQRKRA